MIVRMTSLAVTPAGRSPSTVMAMVPGRRAGRVWVARTCSTSLVPMPKARAPKAPWVDVWLSPHTTVIPGWVRPELGADDVDDALPGRPHGVERDPVLGAVVGEGLQLAGGDGVGEGEVEADGGRVVVGRGQGEVGAADGAPGQAQAVEGLGRGDLVDQVEVDVEQVGLVAGAGVDDVLVPHLLGQRVLAACPTSWDTILAIWEQYRVSACSTRRFPSSTRWRAAPLGLGELVDGHRPAPGHRPPAGGGAGGPRPGRARRRRPLRPRPPAHRPGAAGAGPARPGAAAGRHRRERAALRAAGRPPAVRGVAGVAPRPAHDRPRGRVAAARRGLGGQGAARRPVGRRRRVGRERGGAGAGRGVGQRPGPRSGRRGGGGGVGVGADRAHDPLTRRPLRAGPGGAARAVERELSGR